MVEHASRGPAAGAPGQMTVSQAWASYVEVSSAAPKTMSVYESVFVHHVDPALGARAVAEVARADVQELLDRMRSGGSGPAVVRHARVVLSLVCRRAVELGVIDSLPTEGVRTPRPAAPATRVMTPAEFARVREALPTPGARLLAELLVRSGLRLGEALALTPGDVGDDSLVVRRCLSEPGRRFTQDGQRFVIRSTTKNGAPRRVVVGRDFADGLRAWCAEAGMAVDDLVFPAHLVLPPPSGREFPRRVHSNPLTPERLEELGTFTGPNGLRYQHGTMNGYVTGRCREACCRQAISEYSAGKRRERRERQRGGAPPRRRNVLGTDQPAVADVPSGLGVVTPQSWARTWADAVRRAGLDHVPLARHTRHAHASWLAGGGVSVEQVADRLGHRDERSTRWYLRPVGLEQDAVGVLDALLGGAGSPPDRTGAGDL